MVALNDVVRRHGIYAVSVACLVAFSNNWPLCTLGLSAATYGLSRHSRTSLLFPVGAGLLFTVLEILLVSTPTRTTRYDYAIPQLGVPLWLLPWWAVRSHWVLDIYCVCGIWSKRYADKEGGSAV